MIQFQIRKDDVNIHRLVDSASSEDAIEDGQIKVSIRQFALTANNITYAVVGDRMGYWQFFPPLGDDTDGWGVMPVWGFAEVVESKVDQIHVGERIFGYFPPATELTMSPAKVSEIRFVEGAAHRSKLPGTYNNYRRVNAEPGYTGETDNERMLLSPLFGTSFCLWDSLSDNDWYGAKQIVIVSASSKTSIGLSYALHDDPTAPTVIGVTSARNLDFVNGLGIYDQVVTYDLLANIDSNRPTVIVDMSGDGEVLGALHSLLADNMMRCLNVGLTHWGKAGPNQNIIADRSELFFAPAHIQKRAMEWGPVGLEEKVNVFMTVTAAKCRDWMKIRQIEGLPGIGDIYNDVCEGRMAANEGLIVQL